MTSCVRNIHVENYQNLIIGFKVTVKKMLGMIFETVQMLFSLQHHVVPVSVHCND